MKFTTLFLCTLVFILLLDMLWLGLIAKNIYARNLGSLMRQTNDGVAPIWWSAAIVYLCLALGIVFFILPLAQGNLLIALANGALFGLITYGVYDFTNYATLANWPLALTFVDLCWGITLCGLSSLFGAFIESRFLA